MSEEPKTLEEKYSVPKDGSNYIINEKFIKSAVRHFLELSPSFTISALTHALQQEYYYEGIKIQIENMSIIEFAYLFEQFYFEKRNWKDQKKELLTFIRNYEFFLQDFPKKFKSELLEYNIIHGTKYHKINFIPCYGGITKNIYENKNDLNYKSYILNGESFLPITGEEIPDPNNLLSLIQKSINSNTDSNTDVNTDSNADSAINF